MRKNLFKLLSVVVIITCVMGSTVFADDITDLKNEQSQVEAEKEKYENELADLLVKLNDLEYDMANMNDQIDNANKELEEAQKQQDEQYEDMKLRIKYLYEDHTTTISEVFVGASDMGDLLNKVSYVQQVYDYDRKKLKEMSETAERIKGIKTGLEEDKQKMLSMQEDFLEKQATLYKSIDDAKAKSDDLDEQISDAVRRAAQISASKQPQNNTPTFNVVVNNDSSTANNIVSMAYSLCGIPYVYGGTSPSGFDCSGFTSYVFRNNGISIARTSGGQTYGGVSVGGLSNALPGDIICYPGHVGIYIGNGQMIHATYPGDIVRTSSVNIGMSIVDVRRYW